MYRIIIAAALAIMCACSEESTSDNIELAKQKGREAAIEAINAKAGSMQREKAMLAIKAMHHRIMEAGDTAAADAYLLTAEEMLDSAQIIKARH